MGEWADIQSLFISKSILQLFFPFDFIMWCMCTVFCYSTGIRVDMLLNACVWMETIYSSGNCSMKYSDLNSTVPHPKGHTIQSIHVKICGKCLECTESNWCFIPLVLRFCYISSPALKNLLSLIWKKIWKCFLSIGFNISLISRLGMNADSRVLLPCL